MGLPEIEVLLLTTFWIFDFLLPTHSRSDIHEDSDARQLASIDSVPEVGRPKP